MTQPNKDTPAGSIAYGSLSEHASKTEADWRAENKQQLEGQFDQAIQGMVTLLGPIPIIGDLLEIFTGKEDGDYNDFGTAFNRWKNFWGANLKGLLDAVMDFLEPVKEFVDGFADVGTQVQQAIDGGVKFVTDTVAFVGGGIAATVGAIGTAIADGLKGTQATLENIGKAIFNVPTPAQFQGSIDGARDWLNMATAGLMDLLGINRAKADTAIVNNQLTNAKIYEGFFGVGGSGEVAQAQETIAAIKTEIFKGFTLESLTVGTGSQLQSVQVFNATGGTFTLTYDGQETGPIAYNASAETVKTAIGSLSTVGSGNATVTVLTGTGFRQFDITLSSSFSTFKLFSVKGSSLTGSGAYASVLPYWKRPWTASTAPKEFYVVMFGAGAGGSPGTRTTSSGPTTVTPGGAGGLPGGYVAVELDAATLPDWTYFIVASGGVAGTASNAAGGTSESQFGGYATTQAGLYYVQNLLGYYTTNQSAPGAGGAGGGGYVAGGYGVNGSPGVASLLAAGGAAGTGTYVDYGGTIPYAYWPTGAGQIGANAVLDGKARAGGGGGGGGGGAWAIRGEEYYSGTNRATGVANFGTTTPLVQGGLGGNGGFPGGGAGGGGAALTFDIDDGSVGAPAGNGGIGGNGVIILLWR